MTLIRFIIGCVMTCRFKVRQSITALKYYKLEKKWSTKIGQVHFLGKSYLFKLFVFLYIAERSMKKSDKFNTFITIFRFTQYDLSEEEPTMSRTCPAFVLKYRNGGANVALIYQPTCFECLVNCSVNCVSFFLSIRNVFGQTIIVSVIGK